MAVKLPTVATWKQIQVQHFFFWHDSCCRFCSYLLFWERGGCIHRLSVPSVRPEIDLDWTSWSFTQKEHFIKLNICWAESSFLIRPLYRWVSVLQEEWQIYVTVMSFHQWNIKMKDVWAHIYISSLCWYTCFSSSFHFLCAKFWRKKKIPQLQFSFAELVQFTAPLQTH